MKQFTVICTRDQYEEVAQILEGWGYELLGRLWLPQENCVQTSMEGHYMTFSLSDTDLTEPRYTLEELREMENPNTETL